jgi:hypothetical protein
MDPLATVRPVPVSYESADELLRRLLEARPGGFREEGYDLVVTIGERPLYLQTFMFGPDAAVIQVMAPLVAGVANSDELCEVVATADLAFGRLLLIPETAGTRSVELVARFHADQLRADVLEHALASVAAGAERWDPELESRFGATWTLEGPS